MNYLFFYCGEIPGYVHKVVNTILSVDKEADVYFLSDKNIKSKYISHININDFNTLSDKMELIKDMYSETISDYKLSPLWATSLLRIFAIEHISNELNLSEFVHFDTDVLIYKPFSEIKNGEYFKTNTLNITFENPKLPIYGYSYVNNLENLVEINKKIDEFINTFINMKPQINNNPYSEMKLLGWVNEQNSNLIRKLPSLPFESKNFLFDPVSYGMYLGGADFNQKSYFFKKSFIDLRHDVGAEIKSKRIKVTFKNNLPYVIENGTHIPLVNLHIHSKKFDQFLPESYKEYMSEESFKIN